MGEFSLSHLQTWNRSRIRRRRSGFRRKPESHPQKQDPSVLPTDQATTHPEDPQQYETSPWIYRPDECHEHASGTHCEAKAVSNSVESEIAGVVE